MQIKITGKNLDIGEALREHIDGRLRQLQAKYFEGTVHGHVTIEKQRVGFDSAKMWAASEAARPTDSPSGPKN